MVALKLLRPKGEWTEPERVRVQLLIVVLLVIAMSVAIASVWTRNWMVGMMGVGMFVSVYVSRSRPSEAVAIAIIVLSVGVLLTAHTVLALVCLLVPVLLSSIFLGFRVTVIVMLANALGIAFINSDVIDKVAFATAYLAVAGGLVLQSKVIEMLTMVQHREATQRAAWFNDTVTNLSGLILVDASGHIIECNDGAARLLRLSHCTGCLLTLPQTSFLANDLHQCIYQSERVTGHYSINGASIRVQMMPIGDQPQGAIMVCEDTSWQDKFMRDRLRVTSLTTARRLAGGTAMTMSTPVTSILTLTQLLGTRELESEVSTMISSMAAKAEKLQAFVRKLLAVSVHSGITCEVVQIDDVLADCFTLIDEQMQNDGIVVSKDIPPTVVMAHPESIYYILLNVMYNARDALNAKFPDASSDKQLSVKVTRQGECALVIIHDTGVGIPADMLEMVFTPFAKSQLANGSGLSLAMAYGQVREMGGDMQIESKFGEYTTVRIELNNYPIA